MLNSFEGGESGGTKLNSSNFKSLMVIKSSFKFYVFLC